MLVMGCILSLTLVTDNAIAASKKKVVKKHVINSNEFNDEGSISTRQEPDQLDCQALKIDERWTDGGTVHYKKICFYDVIISQNKHVIMWNDVYHPNHYGFISNSPVD